MYTVPRPRRLMDVYMYMGTRVPRPQNTLCLPSNCTWMVHRMHIHTGKGSLDCTGSVRAPPYCSVTALGFFHALVAWSVSL